MTMPIEWKVKGGKTVRGAIARPDGVERAPAVIVVQEWWGLNEDMKGIATRLAGEGFVALAVDLYDGQVTTDRETAARLMTEMKTPAAIDIVAGAAQLLAGDKAGNGAVGVTGFCMGGAVALASACHVPWIGACVPFYGMPRPEHVDWHKARAAFLLHYGRNDPSIPLAKVEKLRADLEAAGRDVTLHLYDAGHAFMRRGDPAVYEQASAELAWQRTVAFLRQHLAGPTGD